MTRLPCGGRINAGFALQVQYLIGGAPALLAALAVAFARPRDATEKTTDLVKA